jgi:uncharacterized phage-associated protein
MDALLIAKYILSLSDPERGDIISNLKLQKLLYYAQGFFLAIHDKPLFKDKIYAWEYGPVVENVYHEYKHYGSNAIEKPKNLDYSKFNPIIITHLEEINTVFGQYSAWRLMQMAHSEKPWIDARKRSDCLITQKELQSYFKTRLE